jgi:signal transduction histidine kinase
MLLLITDNGRGFQPAEYRPDHPGLQSMRDRAAAVGGMLELVGAVGRGTQSRASIPVRAGRDG